MMKLARGFVASATLATSACVPMEQASLTYTSRTTMGVGVSAGTQDTPGLEVTIGFKETNIALVPIAVAKYCYKATEAQCQDAIYRMQMVTGRKTDDVENLAVQKQIEAISGELTRVFGQQGLDTKRLAELKPQIELAEVADAAAKELAGIGKEPVVGEPPENGTRRAVLTDKANLRPANFDVVKARKEVAKLDAAQNGYADTIDRLQRQRAQLSAQLNPNSNSARIDAYSVYGKFNGGATGGKDGAGLTVGKVFATGIAAQNLTEFATTADCLANIRLLAGMMPDGNDAAKAALLGTARDVCKPAK